MFEKLEDMVQGCLNKINEVSKLDFTKEYIYLFLKDYKLKFLNYLQTEIEQSPRFKSILMEVDLSCLEHIKPFQKKINLFNNAAQELADKVGVIFSQIELNNSIMEINLKENG